MQSIWRLASYFRFPIRLLAFWLLFFTFFRLVFLVWFAGQWPEAPVTEFAAVFWHALPLDLSMAGYLVLGPFIWWYLSFFDHERLAVWYRRLTRGLTFFSLLVLIPVYGSNLFIYGDWHTLINARAIVYLKSPAALFDSLSVPVLLFCAVAYAVLLAVFWWAYRRIVDRHWHKVRAEWPAGLAFPLQAGLLVLAIRGGVGVMAINESAVYFSRHLFLNHAATNSGWHLAHSLLERGSQEHHYRFLEDAAAQERVDRLLRVPERSAEWLLRPEGQAPNIVLVIMESMTAQVVEELGGTPGVCPNLSRLSREGILFDRCYSSGYRTDQGLVSILAGFPALPEASVVQESEKAAGLPTLTQVLNRAGYQSAFYYGGALTFANIGVWLSQQGFYPLVSERDFDRASVRQRWGVDDELLFKRVVSELGSLRQPFFCTALTLSLHTPFDVPYTSPWNGPSVPEQFTHSAAFADAAIGAFMDAAAAEPWYDNTLFIFVADHGNSMPSGKGLDQAVTRQVPMVLAGPLVAPAWRGRRLSAAGNHHDLPGTLLPALGYANPMPWSRNLFAVDPARSFGFHCYEDGMGWVTDRGETFRAFRAAHWDDLKGAPGTEAQRDAEAYLQALYSAYLAL